MISQERRDELRREFSFGSGTHKPIAYWEIRTLLDYADERDEAVALLKEALQVMDEVGPSIHENWATGQQSKTERLGLVAHRIDALLRRVGGNHD